MLAVVTGASRGLGRRPGKCRGASSRRRSASTFSTVALCRAFIPSMKAVGRGWIINIAGRGCNHAATNVRGLRGGKGRSRTLH